jgi:Tol biopolymer transport system component
MCRIGQPRLPGQVLKTFEICVIDARGDEYGTIQLTQNNLLDATPSWSPDGTQIVFHRNAPPPPSPPAPFQLWVVKAEWICDEMGSSCTCQDKYSNGQCEMQLTNTPGVMNAFPHWGVLRVHVPKK